MDSFTTFTTFAVVDTTPAETFPTDEENGNGGSGAYCVIA
jgi:hypothetical protein